MSNLPAGTTQNDIDKYWGDFEGFCDECRGIANDICENCQQPLCHDCAEAHEENGKVLVYCPDCYEDKLGESLE